MSLREGSYEFAYKKLQLCVFSQKKRPRLLTNFSPKIFSFLPLFRLIFLHFQPHLLKIGP